MSMNNSHLDSVFRALFPYHNDHADENVVFVGESTREVYSAMLGWLSSIIVPQMIQRTLTIELTRDLEELADVVRQILGDPVPSTWQDVRRLERVSAYGIQLRVEFECQKSCSEFMRALFVLEYYNLEERYRPLVPNGGRKSANPIMPHVAHILRQVRLETTEYKLWKRNVEEGAPHTPTEQPPAFWNRILKDVSNFAREVRGGGSQPEPLTFERIMYILEQADARQRSPFQPGAFLTNQDLFKRLDSEEALKMLIQDFWALERRRGCTWARPDLYEGLEWTLRSTLAARYGQVAVSATGTPIAVWRHHDGINGGGRIDIGPGHRGGYLRFGLPEATAISRTVHEAFDNLDGDLDALQWHVDIAWVRDNIVVDWGDLGKYQEHQAGPDPPSYDELFGNSPPYEEVPSNNGGGKGDTPSWF